MSEQQPPSGHDNAGDSSFGDPSYDEQTQRHDTFGSPSYWDNRPREDTGHNTRRTKPSGAFTAGILVAALVIGGLSGLVAVAGASAFGWFDSDDTSTSSASPEPAVPSETEEGDSPVVATEDTPPDPGSVEDVATSVLPSVVQILVQSPDGQQGSGSGIIVSAEGEILTNDHVVEVAENGGLILVSFDDGATAEAEVLGTDPLTDLAVIQADDVAGLTPATLGVSENLDVGQEVVAIGSPFGLEATVTSGIVSALNRPVSVAAPGSATTDTTYPAIQTDAAINPGNSGGPLVNMDGEVIGVNSSIRTSSAAAAEGGSIGLGFAIPLGKVLPIVEQLREGEDATHARLGVMANDATGEKGVPFGARITSVEAGSAAEEAGLERGDVVVRIDDDIINGASSLVATIRGYRPGDSVTLAVARDGDRRDVDVTLDSDEGLPPS
jgi:putative serine protease PepD